MEPKIYISSACFLVVVLVGILFSSLYLLRKKFMPYHAVAVGKTWDELDKNFRVLIIALMRVAGGGWLAASTALGILLYFHFMSSEPWITWIIFLTGLSVTIPTLAATVIVRTRTNARPPVYAAVLALVLLFGGFLTAML